MPVFLHDLLPWFSRRMRLASRPLFVWRIVVTGAAVLLVCLLVPSLHTREWFLGLLAVVGGVGYFLIQQHLNEAKFFLELFEKFNRRYDEMNGTLQTLLKSGTPFEPEDRLLVIDYFNLCSEEWLFFRSGYIDPSVWAAWHSGMELYGRDKRFADLWKDEGGGPSYYEFQFPITRPPTPQISS